jgi:hypothetical protein
MFVHARTIAGRELAVDVRSDEWVDALAVRHWLV